MEQVERVVPANPARIISNLAPWLLTLSRIGFGAAVVLIPFRARTVLMARPIDPIYHDYTDILVYASDWVVLTTLAFWLLHLVVQPRPLKVGPSYWYIPMIGLMGTAVIGIPFSVDPLISLDRFIRLIGLGLFYLYVLNEIKFDQLALPVALQVGIQAVVGVVQVLAQRSLGLTRLQELALNPAWSGVSIVWAEGVRSLRAYGLTDHPNILGGCLAFGLVVIGTWLTKSRANWQFIGTTLFALGSLALLVTFSRSAWIALISGLAGCLVLFLVSRQREPIIHWLNVGVSTLILLLPFIWFNAPYLGVRLNANNAFTQVALEDRSLSERDYLAQGTLQIWEEHPLFGIGFGALPEAERARFPDPDVFGGNYQPAHFVLLDVAAETGIVSAFFFFILSIAPWCALWLNRKRLRLTPALIGVSGLLVAVTCVGFFDYYTWELGPGQLWQWLTWGLWNVEYLRSMN